MARYNAAQKAIQLAQNAKLKPAVVLSCCRAAVEAQETALMGLKSVRPEPQGISACYSVPMTGFGNARCFFL